MVFRCMPNAHANRINREMDRLLSTVLGEAPSAQPGRGQTATANVWETDDAWLVEMELPGVRAENLDIALDNGQLTISVERPQVQEKDATYYRRECCAGSFSRSVKLPAAVDGDQVEAALDHGVLTVTLPKSEAARRRKIEVKAASSTPRKTTE